MWEKIGIAVSTLLAVIAIWAQITTPEIRCSLGLNPSGCSNSPPESPRTQRATASQSPITPPLSPSTTSPSPTISMLPSEDSLTTTMDSEASQEENQEEQISWEQISKVWFHASKCVDNNNVEYQVGNVLALNSSGAVDIASIGLSWEESGFWSTTKFKVAAIVATDYQVEIRRDSLYFEVKNRSLDVRSAEVNGTPTSEARKKGIEKLIRERDLLTKTSVDKAKGAVEKYNILSIEGEVMVLENPEGQGVFQCRTIRKFMELELES